MSSYEQYVKLLGQMMCSTVSFEQSELEAVFPYFHLRQWKKNERVFDVGDRPSRIDFLMEGVGRVFYVCNDNKEKNKSILCPGDVFICMNTLIEKVPSPFGIQALTDCSALSIEYEDAHHLCVKYPKWDVFFRMRLEQFILKKEKREADLLTLSASQRYEEFLNEFNEYANLIPLKHTALYLGITDVALSRIRKQMGIK